MHRFKFLDLSERSKCRAVVDWIEAWYADNDGDFELDGDSIYDILKDNEEDCYFEDGSFLDETLG